MSRRVVFALHDAGGTVPPVIAVAEALVATGNDVAVLGQPSIRARAEAAGCRFTPFESLGDYRPDIPLEEQTELVVQSLAGASVGDDLVALARRFDPDVVVVDPNLAGCLAAAKSLPCPSAVLLHSMYATFVDTWFDAIWPLLTEEINRTRAGFGLAAVESWAGLLTEHDRLIAVVPSRFEAPTSDGPPPTIRHYGFLVPHGSSEPATIELPPGDEPAVLVALSTTHQDHEGLLAAIVEALAGLAVRGAVTTGGAIDPATLPPAPRLAVTRSTSHRALIGNIDLVVTHAGLGTVAMALSAGVPLVATPVGRDQPLNAQRVADLGAGVAATATDPTGIAAAVETVLGDGRYRQAARDIAAASDGEGGAVRAAAELIELAAGEDASVS